MMEFAAGVLEFIGVGQVTDVTEQAVLALAAKVLFFYLIALQPGHLILLLCSLVIFMKNFDPINISRP